MNTIQPDEQKFLQILHQKGTLRRRDRSLVWCIEDPADRFTYLEKGIILSEIQRITTAIFGYNTKIFWENRPNWFEEITDFWVVEHHGRFGGWCSSTLWKGHASPILYIDNLNLWASVLGLKFRRLAQSLVVDMWIHACIQSKGACVMTFRSQTPASYRLLLDISPRCTYPQVAQVDELKAPRASIFARETADKLSPGKLFDKIFFVLRKAHAGALAIPVKYRGTGDPLIDGYFLANVNVKEGDALIGVFMPDFIEVIRAIFCYPWFYLLIRFNFGLGRKKRRRVTRVKDGLL